MKKSLLRLTLLMTLLLLVVLMTSAHEEREVGTYILDFGWQQEPVYTGLLNGVELTIFVAEADDHNHDHADEHSDDEDMDMEGDGHSHDDEGDDHSHDDTDEGHAHSDGDSHDDHDHGDDHAHDDTVEMSDEGHSHDAMKTVDGADLLVEITFGPASVTLPLVPSGQPGHYTANLIPTRPGDYTFRVFGTIGDMTIDEVFTSADGLFDTVEPATDIQFPPPEVTMSELLDRIEALEDALNGE